MCTSESLCCVGCLYDKTVHFGLAIRVSTNISRLYRLCLLICLGVHPNSSVTVSINWFQLHERLLCENAEICIYSYIYICI